MKAMRLYIVVSLLFLLIVPLSGADPVTDDSLYDKVRIQIANDREIGGHPIDVKVNQGVVELTGKVKTDRQKAKAEKIAKKVKGVKSVINSLTISPV